MRRGWYRRRHPLDSKVFIFSMKSRLLIGIVLPSLFLSIGGQSQTNNVSAPSPHWEDPGRIVHFLTQTISWYRRTAVEQQLASEPSDLTFLDENRRVADQVVQLAFEYARAQAQRQAKRGSSPDSSSSAGNQSKGLAQAMEQTEQQIRDTQAELQGIREKLGSASPATRRTMEAQIAELESELGLLQARRDALGSMLEFTNASQTARSGMGLRAQIEELARSVLPSLTQPGASNQQPNSQASAPSNNVFARKAQPTGIWGLGADLLQLSDKRRSLDDEISATSQLSQSAAELREPLLGYLSALVHQGEQLFAAADTAKVGELVEQKRQLDALTALFKQTSTELLPLSKILVLTDIYKRTLNSWRAGIGKEEHDELRQLFLRVGVLVILISLVFVIGEIWRRTTFRYVHDVRRRYQFLLLRRVVLWIAITLIVLVTFASQLGSAVTFAGLITAGVAVALQNVILSVVAYFFLIGKYGIRIGDRVQIAGVAGEVVDLGLVRIHLMELSGQWEPQPTGRIVAFSNSIVFQPTAGVFKQIPGTNFIWHEVKLTLAAETDYQTAKTRITQAVDQALAESHKSLEAQRRMMESLAVSPTELRPKVSLRYTTAGIEATVRFPVELGKVSEMDDALMKEIISSLEQAPRVKLLSTEMSAPAK